MSTIASPMVAKLWDAIHEREPLAIFSGSVGDLAHQQEQHTYHISWDDQAHDNGYSVHYWGDSHELSGPDARAGDVSDMASAIDVSFAGGWVLDGKHFHQHHYDKLSAADRKRARTISSEALMVKHTARLHHLAHSGALKPWETGVREFAGTLDGRVVFAMDTTPEKNGPVAHETFGWDSSHLWHIHISINRCLVNTPRILNIAKAFG